MTPIRPALVLPVVLMIILLLGLLVAVFAFRVNADLASTQAIAFRLQTRLAAEAGVDRVRLLLAESRLDMDRWYNNPEELHRIVVWVDHGNDTVWGSNDEFDDEDATAFRFSIVADDPTDDEDFIRLGITDEASKLNLNTATEEQLRIVVRAAVGEDEEIIPQDILDAILDWRDKDSIPRGEDGDTEGDYYRRLPKPYRVKNGPFDTVEELLLVKGVTGRILYGEDFDRNGLITPNEDDGDESFPPDNEDGVLNRGMYPYLTVVSYESNVSNSNRARVYLLGDPEAVREGLYNVFPDEPGVIDYIVTSVKEPTKPDGGDGSTDTEGEELEGEDENPDDSTGEPEEGAEELSDEPSDGAAMPSTKPTGGQESDDGKAKPTPIRTPASLFVSSMGAGGGGVLTFEHLPALMDGTTTLPPEKREIPGLININTAPPMVLRCIDGLTREQIGAIVEMRGRVPPEDRATTAWLLTEGVVDPETYVQIAPQITARGQQFTIESLGYADHLGMVTRLHVVVDMVGPIAQTVYHRDLTYIGGHFPIREKDLERIRVR
jgi:DNA uptake protein ComE-like DNA-binding protein